MHSQHLIKTSSSKAPRAGRPRGRVVPPRWRPATHALARRLAAPRRHHPQLFGGPVMLQLTPQSRIFVATEPVDFRKGIDGLGAVCRQRLGDNPMEGAVYVF